MGTTRALWPGMRNPTLLCWLSTLTFLGCATASYVYSPRDAATSMDGYPATVTAVPPEAPQGKVEVTSFGILGILGITAAPGGLPAALASHHAGALVRVAHRVPALRE